MPLFQAFITAFGDSHLITRAYTFRKQHGGFQRPEELMNVKGIGEKSYAKLKPYLALTPVPRPAAATK